MDEVMNWKRRLDSRKASRPGDYDTIYYLNWIDSGRGV
jgi:hypothetical protein